MDNNDNNKTQQLVLHVPVSVPRELLDHQDEHADLMAAVRQEMERACSQAVDRILERERELHQQPPQSGPRGPFTDSYMRPSRSCRECAHFSDTIPDFCTHCRAGALDGFQARVIYRDEKGPR